MQSELPYWRLSSFYFFYFCVVGAISPFWPSYLADLGYSAKEIGIMTGVIMGTRLIAPNFWSWIADRSGERLRIVRWGSGIACVLFIGVFLETRFWWLLAVVCGYTFFWHAVLPQFEVITLGYLEKTPSRYGQIRLWGSIGFIVAVMGLGMLFDIVAIAYLPVAIFVFLLLILSTSFGVREQQRPKIPRVPGLFQAQLCKPFILLFLLASFLLQLSLGPYYTFFTLYLVDNLGYSRSFAGLMWALGVFAEVIMFLCMPTLMKRFSLKTLFVLMLALTTLRWIIIGVEYHSLLLLLFAQALHAWTFAVAHAVSIDIIRRHFNGTSQGQGQALYGSMSFGLGGALGAFLSGMLWADYGGATFLWAAMASALAIFVVIFSGKWPNAAH